MVRKEVKFEEEKVFRRSLDFEMEDQQGTTQVTIFSESKFRVTGFRCDWVTSYKFFSYRGSIYRYF